jgi:carbon monoxide dehydrogenase subunit G
MKVSGTALLHADPDRVYAAFHDPSVLAVTIPGCQSLEALGDDRYRLSIVAGVASIKGTYDGEVALSEQDPPSSFTLRAKGSGAPGTVDATVHVTLAAQDDGTTRLEYDADAIVGGMVGGVGQRMLAGVSRKMAGQFFGAVDDSLAGRGARETHDAVADHDELVPAAAVPAYAPVSGPIFPGRAGADIAATGPDQRSFVLGAAFGAGVALLGVLVGSWVGGRRARR